MRAREPRIRSRLCRNHLPLSVQAKVHYHLVAVKVRVLCLAVEFLAMRTRARPATSTEVLQGIRRTTKNRHALERLLAPYPHVGAWTETAFVSTCVRTGTALMLSVSRHADLYPDGSIYLDGTYGNVNNTPFPGVHAEFLIQVPGTYACTVRMARGLPYAQPTGTFEFQIRRYQVNPRPLGTIDIPSLQPRSFTFLVHLDQARHTLDIRPTTSVGFQFFGLTVRSVPELVET